MKIKFSTLATVVAAILSAFIIVVIWHAVTSQPTSNTVLPAVTSQPTSNTVLPPTPNLPSKPPIQLANGTFLVKQLPGGNGELTIKNGFDSDAVVVLSNPETKVSLLAVYVQSNSSYTATMIPDGIYDLYFKTGIDWDDATKAFRRNTAFSKFEDKFDFLTTQTKEETKYKTWTVTLNPVPEGNAPTQVVIESQFPELH